MPADAALFQLLRAINSREHARILRLLHAQALAKKTCDDVTSRDGSCLTVVSDLVAVVQVEDSNACDF